MNSERSCVRPIVTWQPPVTPLLPASHRLATSVVRPETQVVTHLCYSDFEDILPAIDGLKGAQQASNSISIPALSRPSRA